MLEDPGDLRWVTDQTQHPALRPARTMQHGNPIGGVRVQLLRISRDNPFRCHPPTQISSAAGLVDFSRCSTGGRYVLRFPEGGFRTTDLPPAPQRVLVLLM